MKTYYQSPNALFILAQKEDVIATSLQLWGDELSDGSQDSIKWRIAKI